MVLYLLVVMAMINVISSALLGDVLIPTLFFLVGFVTSFFHKNMIIILAVAMCISNMIKYGTKIRISEGMETEGSSSSSEDVSTSTSNNTSEDTKTRLKELIKRSQDASGQVMDTTNPQPLPDVSKMDPASLKEAKLQLKELKTIHDSITKNMSTIEDSLKNAEAIFDKVKEGFIARQQR